MVHTYERRRSTDERDCRDAFLGLARTAAQPAIAFWDYLGDRLRTSASSKSVRRRASPDQTPQVFPRNGSISPTKG